MDENKSTWVHCKISDIINELEKIKSTYGNLNVILWDQEQVVKFNHYSEMFQIIDGRLFVGGFHVNGVEFISPPEMKL